MAVDMFLKLDGIDGESTDSKHKDEIEILAYGWGVAQQGTSGSGGGGGAGKAAFEDLHVLARLQKSSPKLFIACTTGKHVKQGVLTVRKAGSKKFEFLKITISDVLVSSFEQVAPDDEGGGTPLEEIGLSFAKIRVDYTQQSAKGAAGTVTSAEWDLKTGKGG
jgi:type VI secretion system secreted protein Hcp